MNIISKIDGILFEKLVVGGALNLKANVEEVNELNVFPIPDGDTGDNMFLTINGGVENLSSSENNILSSKAKALADGMMLNARGNSGVILSQLFYGLSKGLKDIEVADSKQFAYALEQAVKQAYLAVVKPVEGTILTVAREAVEFTNDKNYETINDYVDNLVIEMEKSLERTPELLETLKEAGVIDSGGAGLLYVFKGFKDVLDGKEFTDTLEIGFSKQTVDFSKFTKDSFMEFGYCTEFLLQLQTCKTDVDNFDVQKVIDYLETIGDSIVCYLTGSVVKVHVHSFTPYKALEFCQQFGEFLTIKIENMTLQHNEVTEKETKKKKKGPHKKYAVVAVATGPGLIETFMEMGVDEVIDGGQGKNPSTKRFIEAFETVNAENIFVLPNNSNIILTANEAKELYHDANIYVVNTKDFGQAYSVLSVLDYSCDNPEMIFEMLDEAKDNAITGMITKAIRDTNINHVDIHDGDYIGFSGKTMYASCKDRIDTYDELLKCLDAGSKDFIINVYGENMNEEDKERIEKIIKEKYPNVEAYTIDGGQEVYDIIVILE